MERLKELREEKGLSQAKLAARADINPATVNIIENRKRPPTLETLRKLADALDVPLNELVEDAYPKGQAPLFRPSELEGRRWIKVHAIRVTEAGDYEYLDEHDRVAATMPKGSGVEFVGAPPGAEIRFGEPVEMAVDDLSAA